MNSVQNKELSPGTTLSHYRILSKIGEGGMGEVYLAEDIKLDRKVALKILPPEFAKDIDRMNRFVREAKSASALNHPNILTIYEIDETESGHFIATEFINGETVRERARKTPITLSEALDIATQTAGALAAAHHAGIIHRDIKPENVMVRTDGLVKVLDFGLAKLAAGGASDSEAATRINSDTQPGMIMGTVAYMSPEQARGKAVNPRTDVWSLGVLLYEMLTRRTPFLGETTSDTLANILHREPDALNSVGLPDDLAGIVQSLLAKKLEARYATMADALSDLKRLHRRIEFDSDLQQTFLRSSLEAQTEVVASTTASKPVSQTAADSASSRTDEGFWVAVLPFKYPGSNPDLEALADGLSDDIVTGLSRFSYLRVIARSSTSRFASHSGDVRAIGRELGARYVMRGNFRQAGSNLRLAVQLVDATTGAHLWAHTYDRQFQPDQIFAVQDELVPRIVSTCADHFGVLARSISDAVRSKQIGKLTPYEALMRGFGYHYRLSSEEHAEARQILEKAVEEAPSNADCWAMLSWTYSHEYGHGFNPQPDPLDRALAAARRAVDLAPANHLAYQTLAVALFFRKDKAGCLSAAERAMALNPLDASNEAIFLITFLGDWERGCSLIRRAMDLNPYVPGWYRLILAVNEYRKANYREALDEVTKANVQGTWADLVLSAIHGQLGEQVAARNNVQNLIAENFAESAREMLGKWFDAELVEHLVDGLRKAGLEITSDPGATGRSRAVTASGERPAVEGFWVAVLPFKYRGSNSDIAHLAEGLSEEIVTGLSRFSYLRVIARTSKLRVPSEAMDFGRVSQELGARYVMEGSLRDAGSKLRLAVQLVDTTTGAHLWAENYERRFDPDSIFELQDDLVPRIVSTIADQYGALVHSMSESLRGRSAGQYSAQEAVLRAFGYSERITEEEHREVREILEAAIAANPDHSDCLAQLSLIYWHEHAHGYNVKTDPLGRALAAAQRSVAAAPINHLAHHALATVFFFQKDFLAFRPAAERALALNTMDASTTAFLGVLIAYSGDWEYGLGLVERSMHLNPHHAGWYHFPAFHYAYHKRDYRGALEIALKINMPGYFFMHTALAAVYGQLGKQERARAALRELHALVPDFGAIAREEYGKWLDAELTEKMMDGLRKAGLEIADKGEERSGFSRQAIPSTTEDKPKLELSTPSIAILPFVNISNDSDNEYFCEGLAEELLNALSKIGNLKVAARTSSFSFKGKDVNVGEIGRVLNVSTVLEGSVRKSGNRVRITTQLINAADGYHLWSERYDREMKDIFDVQDGITVAVVEALKIKLLGKEKAAVLKRHTRNPEAYEFYLRGRSHFNRFTLEGFQKAVESFSRAIAIDPRYASAHAGLADACSEMAFFSFSARSEWMPKAKEAANRALELDDTLGEAHNSLAIIKMYYDWDFAGAEHEFKRALALNAGSALIHNWYGWYLGLMGRFDESFKQLQLSQQLDPLSDSINSGMGIVFHWSRQPERAIEQFQKVLELNPTYGLACSFLIEAYEQQGDFLSALAAIEGVRQTANDPLTLSSVGYVYAKCGEQFKALEILNELEKLSNQEHVPAFTFAQIYAGLGDNEQAFAWLDKAYNERSVWLSFLKVDPKFDPLRSDPRFQNVLQRIGLTH